MILIIIVEDNVVIKDGYRFEDIDISIIAAGIHAILWEDTTGEIQYVDDALDNEVITDITPYQDIIDQADAKIAVITTPPTEEELIDIEKSRRYNETFSAYISRFEQHTGLSYKGPDWEMMHYAKNLHRKVDGTATSTQLQLLAIVDHIREKLEELQDYILDPVRTLQELQNVDVTDSIWWPAP